MEEIRPEDSIDFNPRGYYGVALWVTLLIFLPIFASAVYLTFAALEFCSYRLQSALVSPRVALALAFSLFGIAALGTLPPLYASVVKTLGSKYKALASWKLGFFAKKNRIGCDNYRSLISDARCLLALSAFILPSHVALFLDAEFPYYAGASTVCATLAGIDVMIVILCIVLIWRSVILEKRGTAFINTPAFPMYTGRLNKLRVDFNRALAKDTELTWIIRCAEERFADKPNAQLENAVLFRTCHYAACGMTIPKNSELSLDVLFPKSAPANDFTKALPVYWELEVIPAIKEKVGSYTFLLPVAKDPRLNEP